LKNISGQQVARIEALVIEVEDLRLRHEVGVKDGQNELKCRLDLLSKDLNGKWEERLKRELENLRREVEERTEVEKRVELEAMNVLKEREVKKVGEVWQGKVEELLEEASGLKRRLGEKEAEVRERFEVMKNKLESENRLLMEQIERVAQDADQRLTKQKDDADRRLAEVQEKISIESQVCSYHFIIKFN